MVRWTQSSGNLPLPRVAKPELQVWSRSEIPAFLAVAAGDRLNAAWLLALLCGLRRGELAGLRWRDVDLSAQTLQVASQRTTTTEWKVVTKEPKGTSRRTIDLGPLLVAALESRHHTALRDAQRLGRSLTSDMLVFMQPDGEPYHPDRFRELFQALARRAGVPVIGSTMHGTPARRSPLKPVCIRRSCSSYSATPPGASRWICTATESSACRRKPAPGWRNW
jgi:integrase